VLIRLGRWEEAATALDAAVKQENGGYPEARFNLGRVQWLRGEAKSAMKEWEHALKLQPEHVGATVALARAYAEAGDAQRGLKMLDDFSSRMTRRAAVVPREIVIVRGEIIAALNVSGAENNRRPTLITDRSSGGQAPAARVGNNTGRDQPTQAGTSPAP
ncbi:MAG: tetratricopeptide repeat protein, partial [Acidobacteriota bacterium]|nr:tetratricopeptide repeat protein [Acidobacteriota bacterium]